MTRIAKPLSAFLPISHFTFWAAKKYQPTIVEKAKNIRQMAT